MFGGNNLLQTPLVHAPHCQYHPQCINKPEHKQSMRKTNHSWSSMGQKGLPSISNPSSFRFVSGQPVNDSGNNKKQHSGTGYHEDGMEKDLDELSDEEWFQTGVDFVLS
jgi:hypothetical protein